MTGFLYYKNSIIELPTEEESIEYLDSKWRWMLGIANQYKTEVERVRTATILYGPSRDYWLRIKWYEYHFGPQIAAVLLFLTDPTQERKSRLYYTTEGGSEYSKAECEKMECEFNNILEEMRYTNE